MTAFILWYALTAIKIPAELLAIKKIETFTPEELELLKERPLTEMEPARLVSKIKKITPPQEIAIEELKRLKAFQEEIRTYISRENLEELVELKAEKEAVVIIPREPLLFDEGSAELKKEGFSLLDRIIQLLKGQRYYQIRIEGHTDPKPIDYFHRYKFPSNFELSYARAISVGNYLIKNGIEPASLGISGYGAEKPRYPNDTEENRARNRRVEIYITLKRIDDRG